jgi:hypothetical protein
MALPEISTTVPSLRVETPAMLPTPLGLVMMLQLVPLRTRPRAPRWERQCRVTARVAVSVTPPADAEILTEVELLTLLVETVKVALWPPAGTVTLAGTVATPLLLLASVTTVPPAGASSVSITVPCEVLPPLTEIGLSAKEAMVTGEGGGFTLSVADSVALPAEAVMVTRVWNDTSLVETVNDSLVEPAGTVTLVGTFATAVLLLDSFTTVPPDGAALPSVTVPWEGVPPFTEVGSSVTDNGPALGAGSTQSVAV